MTAGSRWLPGSFVQRIAAALGAPGRALRVAGGDETSGRSGADAAILMALGFAVVHTREIIASVWLAVAEGFGVGVGALVGALSRAVAMDLVFLFVGALAVTVLAGRARNLGRDFDLACVAYVPLVAVELAATLIVYLAPVRVSDAIIAAGNVAAYGWAGAVLVLAVREARTSARPAPAAADSSEDTADDETADDDDAADDETADDDAAVPDGSRARPARRARAAAAVLGVLAAGLAAVNGAWIARNLDQLRPISSGDLAPAFALPVVGPDGALTDSSIRLSDLEGKVVILDFWATWCKPCRDSMPALGRIFESYRDRGLALVSINTDDPAKARAFVGQLGLRFPIVFDGGAVSRRYRVTSIPHLIVIDKLGVIRHVHRGLGSERALIAQIERLLAAR